MIDDMVWKVKRAIVRYKKLTVVEATKHQLVTVKMHNDDVISLAYLNRKLANTMNFINHPRGPIGCMENALSELIKIGFVELLSFEESASVYGANKPLYKIL